MNQTENLLNSHPPRSLFCIYLTQKVLFDSNSFVSGVADYFYKWAKIQTKNSLWAKLKIKKKLLRKYPAPFPLLHIY